MAQAPGRFWVIRHQEQGKPQTIAKFDTMGETTIPDDVYTHDNFEILKVSGKSELADQEIDHSDLTDDERDLLGRVYPVE